jgi:fumarate reductase subunit D
MPDKLEERLAAVPLNVGRRLTGLFWEMLPPVLFFFIALMLIFAVVKLLALQYSIRFYAFARAAIGALVLGKVVLLMEMAERKRNASRYPRAIVVAFKTVICAMAVVLFEFGERVVRAWYERGSLREGVAIVKANADLDHFFALLILGCMIIAVYLGYGGDQSRDGRGGANAPVLKAPQYSVSE